MNVIFRQYRQLTMLLIFAFSLLADSQAHALEPELWQKLQAGEAVALIRHAIAPGNGDPAHFVVNDCSTQRNLSEEGKLQAQRIGELFESKGISTAHVFSSQWCRCIDTATGLDLGVPDTLALLNSFYQDRSTEEEQTSQLKKWIKERLMSGNKQTRVPAILVSHQVNITSLTGVYPASGEIVVVGFKDDELVVFGTLETR